MVEGHIGRMKQPYEPDFTFQRKTAHCKDFAYLYNDVANQEQLELPMHCQQRADFSRIDHTFGLLQLAFCLLSIEGRRSPKWLARKVGSTLRTVSHYQPSILHAHTKIR